MKRKGTEKPEEKPTTKEILKPLLTALNSWCKAKMEHDIAYSKYNGYSWDWHGSDFIDDLNRAEV